MFKLDPNPRPDAAGARPPLSGGTKLAIGVWACAFLLFTALGLRR